MQLIQTIKKEYQLLAKEYENLKIRLQKVWKLQKPTAINRTQ